MAHSWHAACAAACGLLRLPSRAATAASCQNCSGACLGASQERLGGAAACAVKRTHLDARMAWKARDSGAELREGFEVGKANPTLDSESGLWTVLSTDVRP